VIIRSSRADRRRSKATAACSRRGGSWRAMRPRQYRQRHADRR